jgi:hypothetical protein
MTLGSLPSVLSTDLIQSYVTLIWNLFWCAEGPLLKRTVQEDVSITVSSSHSTPDTLCISDYKTPSMPVRIITICSLYFRPFRKIATNDY